MIFLRTIPKYKDMIEPVFIDYLLSDINNMINLHTIPQYKNAIQPFLINYLTSKADDIINEFKRCVIESGGPISANTLFLNGGTKYEIVYKTNNYVYKIINVGPLNIAMCDLYTSIGGRRNANRQIDIEEIRDLLLSFIRNSVYSLNKLINFNLIEYNYEANNDQPINTNIII
jgi:hypothetical protein